MAELICVFHVHTDPPALAKVQDETSKDHLDTADVFQNDAVFRAPATDNRLHAGPHINPVLEKGAIPPGHLTLNLQPEDAVAMWLFFGACNPFVNLATRFEL
eukprot:CAMPEP_0172933330 /NCGR_PEP_ID=MMETSP1075-20121228/220453_1 /TAXON_ID=2916 /ORGANISM="Ceratium fusus, Strain PA161109" /LENGTH=101 /DNA_ID=CAMNT_0013794671 /DNA_START=1283 /DNA_END=1588 /DNA_ORIENTATION=+